MTTSHKAFFGDKEREFRITSKLAEELERLTGAGIGALCQRLFKGNFSHADIVETIRLGLIGGGAEPQEAANLIKVYATDVPLNQTYPLAVSILESLWFGKSAQPLDKQTEELTNG